jgi:hypothetical protein
MAAFCMMPVAYAFLSYRMPELSKTDVWIIAGTLASDAILGIFLAALRNHNQSFQFFKVRLGSILFTIGLSL